MILHFSESTTKMGQIPSISLPPAQTCQDMPCFKDCYAQKPYMRARCEHLWHRNWQLWKSNPQKFQCGMHAYLTLHEPEFFRWHVAGEIPDQQYLDMVFWLATEFPYTKFLIFTKRYDLEFTINPSNLTVVFSCWPKLKIPDHCTPRAWMDDGSERRIPKDALKCSGMCETCLTCWKLKDLHRDVYFEKH